MTASGTVAALDPATGTWRIHDTGTHVVRYYRSRVERERLRFEQWQQKATRRVHWRVRDGADKVTVLGLDAAGTSRIADPADGSRTFAWLPEGTYDARGNAMRFEYVPENADGVAASEPFERTRVLAGAFAQRYLKRVR